MLPLTLISSLFQNILSQLISPNLLVPPPSNHGSLGGGWEGLEKLLAMGELNLDYSEVGALSLETERQIVPMLSLETERQIVPMRRRAQLTRSMGKKLVFLMLRDNAFSI